jgi:hypothetical protein
MSLSLAYLTPDCASELALFENQTALDRGEPAIAGKIYNSLIGVTTTVIRGARLVEMLCCLLRADDAICSRRLAIDFAILSMPGSPSGR